MNSHRVESDQDGLQVRQQAQKLCDLALSHHMIQLVDKPTHGREILDLVFASDTSLVANISQESFPLFTDHNILSITVNYKIGSKPNKEQMYLLDSARRLKKLNFSKAPWQDIRTKLEAINWSPMSHLARVSPTLAHSWFLVQLLPVLESLVPLRNEVRGRNSQHRKRKLIWRKLKKLRKRIQNTSSVRKAARLLKAKQDLEIELKHLYTSLSEATEAKVIDGMKEDTKVFYDYAKARQKTRAKVGPFIDPEKGELNLDPEYSAQRLSDQYSSVFTQPRPEWNIDDMEGFFSVETSRPTGYILTDIDFSEYDIELACSELSCSSAPGPDGIPSSLLKICRKELKHPLFILWRSSLDLGVIPPDLLLVLVSPVHKGGSHADPAQYRPVALTSHITKVFERVLRRAMVIYLESQDLLPADQHGFREQRSTLTQLLSHWDQVLDNLEQGNTVDVIYTDFAKAFDKCETNVLLHTLKTCGVLGRVGLWLAAFLDPKSRMQAVGVDGCISPLVSVESGVPQGTVLGPILFLLHIRGINANLSQGTFASSFADDTRVLRGTRNTSDCSVLQNDLNAIYSWANHVNMVFNGTKFEWLRYSPARALSPEYQYLGPDSTLIAQKDSLKDLGVYLSNDLTFSLQIDKVASTANQMVGWGLRTFRGRSAYLLLTLFKSLVQPHLDYCSQLWSPTSQTSINKLEQIQKSLVRRINERRLVGLSYWGKLKALHLYSQERRRERYMIIFIWKITQGLVSGYSLSFTPLSDRTGRKAVPSPVIQSVPAAVRNARAGSLSFRGAQLFNAMPLSLRNSDHGDIPMFKNHLDIFLENVPDEPSVPGLVRAARTNSLLDQIPLYESSLL